jgi:two-component system catabolic regulation response regulator CreB
VQILLVDDSPLCARPLSVMLEVAGHSVTWVTTGHEALQAIAREAFDVAVIDIWLPDTTGYALSVTFALHCDMPLIAMSAGPLCPDTLMGAGFAGGYEKTGEIEPLLSTIRHAIDRHSARRRRTARQAAAAAVGGSGTFHLDRSSAWGRKWH